MKKVLSLILVGAMLLSAVALSTSAATVQKRADGNTETVAYYFGGSVDFRYLYGSPSLAPSKKTYDETEHVKTGNAAAGTLTIDGIISEGEWGAPIATISSKYSASNINILGNALSTGTNDLYQTPSSENTYYYATDHAPAAGMEYDVYLMWDEDYLYIAVKTNDPDGPKQLYNGADIWDGDCLQVRVDTRGVNSSTENGVFDASAVTVVQDEKGNKTTYYPTPWAGTILNSNNGSVKDEVGNFMFSYVSSDGGYTECWDAGHRYGPHEVTYIYNGQEYTTSTYDGGSIADDTEIEEFQDNYCYAVARWDNLGTAKERNDIAVYEIAMPWEVAQAIGTEYTPEAGDVLGMSMVLLDGTKINSPLGSCPDGYTAWLAWGSGICGSQITNDPQTTSGNNAVVLSSTSYKDAEGCDHTFSEATCLAPETCTKCGYQRGYASGHKYIYDTLALPSSGNNGSLTGTCQVCDYVNTVTIKDDGNALHDSVTESSTRAPDGFSSGYTNNWFDMTTYAAEQSGAERNMLFTADGTAKTAFDRTTFGYTVFDFATRGEGYYYVNGEPATIDDSITGNQAGTYIFYNRSEKPVMKDTKTYSYSAEFYMTDEEWKYGGGHTTGIYSQFGGEGGIKYIAGFFRVLDENDNLVTVFAMGLESMVGYYSVTKGNKTLEDMQNQAMACKVIDESAMAREVWHQYNFIYDADNGVAAVYWDGKLQVAYADELLKVESMKEYNIIRRFGDIPFYAKNVYIGTIGYAAANYTLRSGGIETYTVTIDGVDTEYEVGATVSLNAVAFKSATAERFAGWTGDTDVLTENKASTTFTMPSKNVVLTSSYIKVGDANGDGKINAADANYIAQIIVGSLGSVNAADINADGKVNAGDSNLLTKMITGTYSPVE